MLIRNILPLAIFLLPAALWATDVPLSGDASISSANPSLNFGNFPNLTVGSGNVSMLQFELSTLPAGVTSGAVLKATLQVFVNRVGTAGTMEVAPVDSGWTESQVTYWRLPAIGVGAGVSVTQAGADVSIDVTSEVQAWIINPATNFGLALSSNGLVYLTSKENTTTSHPVTLDITLATAPPGNVFVQSYGGLNVAAGPYSMPVDTSGVYNTAFRAETLQVANVEPYKTAVGFQALQNTTTGGVNTAVGSNALWFNTTGSWNNALGASALQQNTTGFY